MKQQNKRRSPHLQPKNAKPRQSEQKIDKTLNMASLNEDRARTTTMATPVSPVVPTVIMGHHHRRHLQFSSSSSNSAFFNSDSYSMVFVVIIVIVFFLLIAYAIKKQSRRSAPSREALLEQRRRQRALIRRERLRQMGINPDNEQGNAGQVQLTAEQVKIRRTNILKLFEQTNVQTVIKEDNLVKDQTQQSTTIESDEEQPMQQQQQHQQRQPSQGISQMEFPMVRLPNRKSTQPDLVANQCAICLESYEVGETIVWSNNEECQHAFHQDCVLDYLAPLDIESPPCPCCRQSFYSVVISDMMETTMPQQQQQEDGPRSERQQQQQNDPSISGRSMDPPGRRIAGGAASSSNRRGNSRR